MNIRNLALALASSLLLAVSSGMAAPQKSPAPVARQAAPKRPAGVSTGVRRGSIVSIDANRIVLSRKKNGKPQELSFTLNPQTSRKGDLAVGNQATVHYKMENNERVATSIQSVTRSGAAAKPRKG